MATRQLEVERKFDVETSFAVPDLAGLGGVATVEGPVEHHLEAVYYDSSDLRLARARITLRRRTGGADAGWHLKLPADDGARLELHSPLGRAAQRPPTAVTMPVHGVLRGAQAAPVATLRTRRLVSVLRDGDGRTLAEVADDTVTATVPATEPGAPAEVCSWREVEVELGTGNDALLAAVGERLISAGARPSSSVSKLGRALAGRLPAPAEATPGGRPTAGELVLEVLRTQVAALQAADVMVRTDRPDAVHQLRVAARRLRSFTGDTRSVLDRTATDPLRDELRWLGSEVSEARDAEVALAHLRDLVAAEPVELVLGPVAARLQQAEVRSTATGHERALSTVSGVRYLNLLDQLHALLEAPVLTQEASRPAGPVLRRALRRAARRLRRRLEAAARADGEGRATALHDVRKAAKRVRYTGEAVAVALGRPAKEVVTLAKRVQTVLGEQQDTVVTRTHCRQLGLAAAAAGENAWTYGRLHGLEQARSERAEAAFDELARSLGPALKRVGRKR